MNILGFIVVDERNMRNGKNSYTITGENYIPCNTPVPVIAKGKGCIGIGMVNSLLITATSTKIDFTLEKDISKAKKEAYYGLYRNTVTVGNTNDDPYESDTVIPGAMAGRTSNQGRRDSGGIGLSEIARQIDQDYSDFF